ncbi:MAG: hypothetical protein ACRDLB_12250 [Actinomycetota bacterium]
MQDRTRVQGRCPTCGPLTLLPRDFVCALPSDPGSKALAEFHCPICDGAVFAPLAGHEATLLMLLGARKARGPAPLELTEAKSGPPVTLDDVLDFHVALETISCPQVELIVGSR